MSASKVLCILDGGHISTVCAALACQQFDEVHAVTCNDGKRSQIELESAVSVADVLNLASHEIIDLSPFLARDPQFASDRLRSRSTLALEISSRNEPTFTSTLSTLFLTLAANQAAVKGIKNIFIGVCEEDFAGDLDRCQSFIKAIARILGEGAWSDPKAITIHTPLIHLTRTKSVKLALDVLGSSFKEVFELTHDCSIGVEGGCGQCQPCLNRDLSFHKAEIEDPIWKFRHPEFRSPIVTLYPALPNIK